MNPTMRFVVPAMVTVVCVWEGDLLQSRRTAGAAGQTPPRRDLQSDLSQYPDYPLGTVPVTPISPRFVIEHRSALHGKTVRIRGTVARVIGPNDEEPSSVAGVAPRPGRFAQPRIFLADSPAKDLAKNYEVVVLLREGDQGYPVGQLVDIEGTVDGNQSAVVVMRLYPDI
jgi:hypothetical protein